MSNFKKTKFPIFLPDATRGFVKFLSNDRLREAGVKALMMNTFYLYLQPGLKIIKKAGGLHRFINWSGPIATDSGGFQVFSLIRKNPKMGKVHDDRITFKSPINGEVHEFTPEKVIQIQFELGSDLMICLDDCPANESSRKELERAVARTIDWARRSKIEYAKQLKKRKINNQDRPLLLAVIQGGAELDLRKKCAEELIKIGFDGYGFGARHIDSEGKFMDKVLKYTAGLIPKDAYKFALGMGTPEDIKKLAKMGWQIFDCVIPSREGRHGRLFGLKLGFKGYETINITNSKYSHDFRAINPKSGISDLKNNSRAYLHHLFKLGDPLGPELASLNNLEFYQEWIERLKD
jgi:queuine tRNA-ribosyltransferase